MSVLLCWLALALVVAPGSCTGPGYQDVAYDIKQAFDKFSLSYVVQDPPSELLNIRFGVQEALLGNQLCTAVTLYYPFLRYEASPNSLNTLICFNPDFGFYYYNTYDLSYIILWVVNIPGGNTYKGDTVIDYKATPPPAGAGPTRNVCLVYEQQNKTDYSSQLLINAARTILQFNLTNFVRRYRLGKPFAGNFYLTQLTLCESDGNGNQLQCGSCAANYFAY